MKVLVTLTKTEWPYTKIERQDVELHPDEMTKAGDGWLIAEVRFVSDSETAALNEVNIFKTGQTAEQRRAEHDPEGRWLTWPPARDLEVGHEYLVRTKSGSQQHPREHRMSYLGVARHGPHLIFNARPAFGTQEFRVSAIIATMDLGKSKGRDDGQRYMNKVIK